MDTSAWLHFDQQLLLLLNGSDSAFLDRLVLALTMGYTWIPLYVLLFYLVVKNNETMLQILLAVGGVMVCLLLADGVCDGIVKPLVARHRPTVDLQMKYLVDVVGNYRNAGSYSFFSAHAANTMAIAVFMAQLVRSRVLSWSLVAWSLFNGWSRLYLGVHYPSDVLVGWLWGALVGVAVYRLYRRFYYRVSPRISYVSSQYTLTGYDCNDINVVLVGLLCTVAAAMIYAMAWPPLS